MTIRVLHVSAALAPNLGGPSKVAVELCEALAARGAAVTLFSTNLGEQGRWRPFTSPALLDVATDRSTWLNNVERRYFDVRWPSRFAFCPDMNRALRERMGEFDVVHVHSLYQFTTAVACHHARRRGVPYLVRPHGTLDPYLRRRHMTRKTVYDRLVQRDHLDCAAAIHCTSEGELGLIRPLGIRAPGVVVPLGLNPEEFADPPPRGRFRALHPELHDRRLIVFLGRLTPKKGLDLLVRAFALVARDRDDAHLVIAGPDDHGFERRVRDLLETMDLRDRATITGMLLGAEKRALLGDADVWVLPSYTENFAMAAVEAMACGLPVVLSDRVDIHGEVTRAGAGLVVPCDAGLVAAAISRVLDDAALARGLARAAADLVRTRFTWDAAATQLIRVYAGLCGQQEPRAAVAR
jgi:glycosyltransferase involved in cell wall biosynthesis